MTNDDATPYVCRCARFAIKAKQIDAPGPEAAALAFAEEHLPGPDRWGQERREEYEIIVECPGRPPLAITVHAVECVVWRVGKLE